MLECFLWLLSCAGFNMQGEWLSEHSSEAERQARRASVKFFTDQFPPEAVLGTVKAAPFRCCGGLLEAFDTTAEAKAVPPPPTAATTTTPITASASSSSTAATAAEPTFAKHAAASRYAREPTFAKHAATMATGSQPQPHMRPAPLIQKRKPKNTAQKAETPKSTWQWM